MFFLFFAAPLASVNYRYHSLIFFGKDCYRTTGVWCYKEEKRERGKSFFLYHLSKTATKKPSVPSVAG